MYVTISPFQKRRNCDSRHRLSLVVMLFLLVLFNSLTSSSFFFFLDFVLCLFLTLALYLHYQKTEEKNTHTHNNDVGKGIFIAAVPLLLLSIHVFAMLCFAIYCVWLCFMEYLIEVKCSWRIRKGRPYGDGCVLVWKIYLTNTGVSMSVYAWIRVAPIYICSLRCIEIFSIK